MHGLFVRLFTNLYNYFFIHIAKHFTKVSFLYDENKVVNILDIPGQKQPETSQQSQQANPYTIVFVANPNMVNEESEEKEIVPDPIINDIHLFLQSVNRSLYSFKNNEILGLEEIWSRIRFVTVFRREDAVAEAPDESEKVVLTESYPISIDDVVIENILMPKHEMAQYVEDSVQGESEKIRADVIFTLSANPFLIRSSAFFSEVDSVDSSNGKVFSFDQSPHLATKSSKKRYHEHYAKAPGLVALNVLYASLKTYIHEFAHAMSSPACGAIVDEYFDQIKGFNVLEDNNGQKRYFCLNRNERANPSDPVNLDFAEYNNKTYRTDLDHPSVKERWIGYFPERPDRYTGCTMDATINRYRFDKIISAFMFDRLKTKIDRPA